MPSVQDLAAPRTLEGTIQSADRALAEAKLRLRVAATPPQARLAQPRAAERAAGRARNVRRSHPPKPRAFAAPRSKASSASTQIPASTAGACPSKRACIARTAAEIARSKPPVMRGGLWHRFLQRFSGTSPRLCQVALALWHTEPSIWPQKTPIEHGTYLAGHTSSSSTELS